MLQVSKLLNLEDIQEDISLAEVFNEIKTGKYQSEINTYRMALGMNKDDRAKELKMALPGFTPGGTFNSRRVAANLNNYSGIIHLDYDHLDPQELTDIKERLRGESHTYAFFESPSRGLKVFVKTDSSIATHKDYFNAIREHFDGLTGIESDKSVKDVARLCFYSYDPELYVNETAKVYSIIVQESLNLENVSNTFDLLSKCISFTDQKESYHNGNRNNYLHLFACNSNRWGIPVADTLDFALNNFDLEESEIRATIKSAYNNTSEHGKFQPNSEGNSILSTIPVSATGLHFMPLEDMILRNQSEPPIPYLWSGIKMGSFGFIFGPSKSGKTTFCENLALSIATGQASFFNKPLTEGAKKVLFVSMEEYWQPRTERNAKQIQELQCALNNNFHTVNEHFPRLINSKDDWSLLREHIVQSDAQVVFIDSLSRMYSGSIEDSNLAKDLLYKLRELTNELKITLVVIHHTPKQIGKPLSIDSLAGSRMLAQEADFMIGISKTPDGNRYMKEVAFRYAQENDETVTTFMINPNAWLIPAMEVTESSLLKASDGRTDDSNAESLLEEIEELTSLKGYAHSRELLSRFVDSQIMSKPTMYANLTKLATKGKIEKMAKGQYRVKQ